MRVPGYSRLYTLSQALAFFLIGRNPIFQCRRIYSHPIGSLNRPDLRPDHPAHRLPIKKDYQEKLRRIKYHDAANNLTLVFQPKQLQSAGHSHYRALPQLYAGRWNSFSKMDQTTPAYQLLRNIGECRQDANLSPSPFTLL